MASHILLFAAAAAGAFIAAPATAQSPCESTYNVRPGDTLYSIAARMGIGLDELLAANQGIDPRRMEIGQVILLPGYRRLRPPRDGDRRRDRHPYPYPGRDDRVVITGVITEEGVECPALRGRDGRLYALAGDTGRFGPGDRVTVRGSLAETSFCMQGTTISVEHIGTARLRDRSGPRISCPNRATAWGSCKPARS